LPAVSEVAVGEEVPKLGVNPSLIAYRGIGWGKAGDDDAGGLEGVTRWSAWFSGHSHAVHRLGSLVFDIPHKCNEF
jgi:hypothetical protein